MGTIVRKVFVMPNKNPPPSLLFMEAVNIAIAREEYGLALDAFLEGLSRLDLEANGIDVRIFEEEVLRSPGIGIVRFEIEKRFGNRTAADEKGLYCSFCGRAKEEVPMLIAGPRVAICSLCIDTCNEVIKQGTGERGSGLR